MAIRKRMTSATDSQRRAPNRILIASSNPWSFSLAVERKLARDHQNDKVDVLDLWSICARHSPHWTKTDRLIEVLNRKIARFIKTFVNGMDITSSLSATLKDVPRPPTDVTEIRQYRVGNARVGLGVLSSVFELTTVLNARQAEEYGPSFAEAWRSAHLSQQIGHAVAKLGYDRVYIFGGRHCYSRPFCDELQAAGVEVMRHEQGGTGTTYVVSPLSPYSPAISPRL